MFINAIVNYLFNPFGASLVSVAGLLCDLIGSVFLFLLYG